MGTSRGKTDGGHAGNGGELIGDVVLDAGDHARIGIGGLRNRDAQGLQTGGIRKSRIDLAQRWKVRIMSIGADQKHKRHGDLGDDQHIAGPVAARGSR